jgi:threonyl-tRNA synthetase (EC 6.1.1.3)/Ser-tRNA(Thr) hydrolase (EC 3.1.1.-)
VTIGPDVENGFYYDFDFERPFTPDDLEKIEERMAASVAAKPALLPRGDERWGCQGTFRLHGRDIQA